MPTRRTACASSSRRPTESVDEFVRRVNRDAQAEEDAASAARRRRGRTAGSHRPQPAQHRLAAPGHVGGLGRRPRRLRRARRARSRRLVEEQQNKDRIDLPVRYALIVSLRRPSEGIDLYTPIEIANEQLVPTEIAIG